MNSPGEEEGVQSPLMREKEGGGRGGGKEMKEREEREREEGEEKGEGREGERERGREGERERGRRGRERPQTSESLDCHNHWHLQTTPVDQMSLVHFTKLTWRKMNTSMCVCVCVLHGCYVLLG